MDAGAWADRGALDHEPPGLDGEPIALAEVDGAPTARATARENGKRATGSLCFAYSHDDGALFGSQVRMVVRVSIWGSCSEARFVLVVQAPLTATHPTPLRNPGAPPRAPPRRPSLLHRVRRRPRLERHLRPPLVHQRRGAGARTGAHDLRRLRPGFRANAWPTALFGPTKTFLVFSASFCAAKLYSLGLVEFVGGPAEGFEWPYARL